MVEEISTRARYEMEDEIRDLLPLYSLSFSRQHDLLGKRVPYSTGTEYVWKLGGFLVVWRNFSGENM